MPEGDTIYRTARTLERVLVGHRVVEAEASTEVRGADFAGRTVVTVEARGKNLLVHFDDARILYTHMRMSGSWHVYRVGERWRRPRRQLRIRLATPKMEAVCFNAPVVEVLTPFRLRQHRLLARLGPDLLSASPDLAEAARRARARSGSALGEVLMAQDVVSGIGNVYKSETLFIERADPFVAIDDVLEGRFVEILERARALMQANLEGYPRTTRIAPDGLRSWVYGRAGEPCFVCGGPIQMRRQGDAGRSTYHCPRCQRPGEVGTSRLERASE